MYDPRRISVRFLFLVTGIFVVIILAVSIWARFAHAAFFLGLDNRSTTLLLLLMSTVANIILAIVAGGALLDNAHMVAAVETQAAAALESAAEARLDRILASQPNLSYKQIRQDPGGTAVNTVLQVVNAGPGPALRCRAMIFHKDNTDRAGETVELFHIQPSGREEVTVNTSSGSRWYLTVHLALASESEQAKPRAGDVLLFCEDQLGGVYLFYH